MTWCCFSMIVVRKRTKLRWCHNNNQNTNVCFFFQTALLLLLPSISTPSQFYTNRPLWVRALLTSVRNFFFLGEGRVKTLRRKRNFVGQIIKAICRCISSWDCFQRTNFSSWRTHELIVIRTDRLVTVVLFFVLDGRTGKMDDIWELSLGEISASRVRNFTKVKQSWTPTKNDATRGHHQAMRGVRMAKGRHICIFEIKIQYTS